ncbi:hypothetical protein SCHPADRAFT_160632 [Schizopora paradoxa]|uniref:Uncharacterized protein n=1 Tax=Schizopora paradoxa TaxID=27342 RepID=A0A0H2RZP6_9AGAM|nr:hypothetical protein SCHPADRAFT_160632 [Schizopora paradoxa]
MSNLEGPGRIVGNLFSSAGVSLERYIKKTAHFLGLGSYTKALAALTDPRLNFALFFERDMRRKEGACALLLDFASSSNPAIQVLAFAKIISNTMFFPTFRSTIETFCQTRGKDLESIVLSWKQPDIHHGTAWLYLYTIASRCLDKRANAIMDKMAATSTSTQYLGLNIIFSSCSDVCGAAVAVEWQTEYMIGNSQRQIPMTYILVTC